MPNWSDGYVILSSIIVNFLLSKKIQNSKAKLSKLVLIVGISFNLAIISYFKYLFFFAEVASQLTNYTLQIDKLILPVGISFYTFQQIAYLVDCYRNRNFQYSFNEYALFVTFFPQLIAGPIVHHTELMPQISKLKDKKFDFDMCHAGILIFIIGLSKKLLLADNLAKLSDPIFSLADKGITIDTLSSWIGALAYTFQLYFDFSAYSDMAIGLGLIFGLNLPINFLSPYKSKSITEFWRRWHITLSSFLRDYLYIPLGGNRNGKFNRHKNLFLTMLLGGLWHGAGWNFMIWGALHGSYLMVNHLYSNYAKENQIVIPGFISIFITMLVVIIAWVFFRAPTFDAAINMLNGMFSFEFAKTSTKWVILDYLLIILASCIAFFAPNTAEIFNYQGIKGITSHGLTSLNFGLSRTALSAMYFGLLLAVSLMFMAQPTVFIYFDF